MYECPGSLPTLTGLDVAICYGNRRVVDKIFQLMAEGLYHFSMGQKQQDVVIAAVDERAGWHCPNVYSSCYPKSKDYDTDKEDEWITLARAEMFMEKGTYTCMHAHIFLCMNVLRCAS